MMPGEDELRAALQGLAGRARDVPAMPVLRTGASTRRIAATHTALVVGMMALLVSVTVIAATQLGARRLSPAAPPTGPAPAAATASPTPTPAPSPSGAPTDPATGLRAPLAMRAMTKAEITSRTKLCLAAQADSSVVVRKGELKVRYAMVQAVAGFPTDADPYAVLLLEDDNGYFDCAGSGGWYGKSGDRFTKKITAAGIEIPTLSGGVSKQCGRPASNDSITSAVVVKTTARAAAARVSIVTRDGTRVVTVSARTGFAYVPVRVDGAAASAPSTVKVELLDADGKRTTVQRYSGAVVGHLDYQLTSC